MVREEAVIIEYVDCLLSTIKLYALDRITIALLFGAMLLTRISKPCSELKFLGLSLFTKYLIIVEP